MRYGTLTPVCSSRRRDTVDDGRTYITRNEKAKENPTEQTFNKWSPKVRVDDDACLTPTADMFVVSLLHLCLFAILGLFRLINTRCDKTRMVIPRLRRPPLSADVGLWYANHVDSSLTSCQCSIGSRTIQKTLVEDFQLP